MIPGGLLIVGLIVGYMAGREHIKYELRSAFQQAANKFQEGLASAFANPDADTQAIPKAASPTLPSTPALKKPRPAPFVSLSSRRGFVMLTIRRVTEALLLCSP
jgi:hypothetical protein